eukprot:g45331.t1
MYQNITWDSGLEKDLSRLEVEAEFHGLIRATLAFRKHFLRDWEKGTNGDLDDGVPSDGGGDGSIPEIGKDFFFVADFQEQLMEMTGWVRIWNELLVEVADVGTTTTFKRYLDKHMNRKIWRDMGQEQADHVDQLDQQMGTLISMQEAERVMDSRSFREVASSKVEADRLVMVIRSRQSVQESPVAVPVSNRYPVLGLRRLRGDLIEIYKIMRDIDKMNGKSLFSRVGKFKTKGHIFKARGKSFIKDMRGNYFTQDVVLLWNELPEDVLDG